MFRGVASARCYERRVGCADCSALDCAVSRGVRGCVCVCACVVHGPRDARASDVVSARMVVVVGAIGGWRRECQRDCVFDVV